MRIKRDGSHAGRPPRRRTTEWLGVLYLNAAAERHLGADQWVHLQVLKGLDRSRFAVHVGLDPGTARSRPPLALALSDVADVHCHPVRLGVGRPPRSLRGALRWTMTAARAAPDLVRLAWVVRAEGIDLLHSPDRPRDAIACVVLGRITRTRSIVHAHVGYGAWMGRGLRWALRHADDRIAVSEFVARTLTDAGHDPARTHVVHNGIELARWSPDDVPVEVRAEVRHELRLPADAPIVLTACRLFTSKGTAELVRALARLRVSIPDVHLVVAGEEMEPGYVGTVRQLAVDLDVADRVHLIGRRTDLERLMAAADVFAMPSVGEPFGLVFAEAMAMELPVVALDSGGAPEIVVSGVTGLLCEDGDPDELAEQLAMLLGDRELCRKMGRLGRQRVEQLFTTGRMVADIEAIYEQVTGRAIPSRREENDDGADPVSG